MADFVVDRTSPAYLLGVAEYERDKYKKALEQIAKEVFTDGTPTKAARIALAALALSRPTSGGAA